MNLANDFHALDLSCCEVSTSSNNKWSRSKIRKTICQRFFVH